MKLKNKTIPDISLNSHLHQSALNLGNDHFSAWSRNVIDEYKGLSNQEIYNQLQQNAFPYAVCVENLISDFNISTVIRNANAFCAKTFYYLGDKKFDRRGAQGCHNYMNIQWLPTIEQFIKLKEQYFVVGLDNIEGAKEISTYSWKPNTLLVFGSEGVGLSPTMQSLCDELVYIKQFGSIRSLNVGTASGIVLHDFVSKIGK